MGIELGMGLDALYLGNKGDYRRKYPVSLYLSRLSSLDSFILADKYRYTRLMATYNPGMLKDEPFGKDWKAAPDPTSFAVDYAGSGAGAGASNGGGAYGASATTGVDSASVSNVGTSASAGAASAGNGAGTSILSSCPIVPS